MNTRETNLIQSLIDQHHEVERAKEALVEAKANYETLWKDYLNSDEYDLPEIVMAQISDHIYEVHFDIDEYGPPTINRVEWCTAIIKLH